jgi:predicted phosphodiesterase
VTVRVAVFSDIHANLPALEAAIADAREQGCDQLVNIGDAVAIGPYPSETLDLLSSEGFLSLKGNHEDYLLQGFPTARSGTNGVEEIKHQRWTREQIPESSKKRVRDWKYEVQLDSEGTRIRLLHFAYDEGGIVSHRPPIRDSHLEELFGRDQDLLVFGHTHVPVDVQLVCRYINPGSLGCSKDNLGRYIVIETNRSNVRIDRREV